MLKQCPYNKSHMVKPTRFFQHLAKCEKNYPNKEMVFCIFNESHIMEPHEAWKHSLTCPDRVPHADHFQFTEQTRYYKRVIAEQARNEENDEDSGDVSESDYCSGGAEFDVETRSESGSELFNRKMAERQKMWFLPQESAAGPSRPQSYASSVTESFVTCAESRPETPNY